MSTPTPEKKPTAAVVFETTFPHFVQLFEQCLIELQHVPWWRIFKHGRLIRKMHRINDEYFTWLASRMEQLNRDESVKPS